MNAYKKGKLAEYIAKIFLVLRGHKIVATRLKNKCGEIDILSKRSGNYFISEVKTRKTQREAIESITKKQTRRSLNAFFAYANYKQISYEQIYFQIILVCPYKFPKIMILDEI